MFLTGRRQRALALVGVRLPGLERRGGELVFGQEPGLGLVELVEGVPELVLLLLVRLRVVGVRPLCGVQDVFLHVEVREANAEPAAGSAAVRRHESLLRGFFGSEINNHEKITTVIGREARIL